MTDTSLAIDMELTKEGKAWAKELARIKEQATQAALKADIKARAELYAQELQSTTSTGSMTGNYITSASQWHTEYEQIRERGSIKPPSPQLKPYPYSKDDKYTARPPDVPQILEQLKLPFDQSFISNDKPYFCYARDFLQNYTRKYVPATKIGKVLESNAKVLDRISRKSRKPDQSYRLKFEYCNTQARHFSNKKARKLFAPNSFPSLINSLDSHYYGVSKDQRIVVDRIVLAGRRLGYNSSINILNTVEMYSISEYEFGMLYYFDVFTYAKRIGGYADIDLSQAMPIGRLVYDLRLGTTEDHSSFKVDDENSKIYGSFKVTTSEYHRLDSVYQDIEYFDMPFSFKYQKSEDVWPMPLDQLHSHLTFLHNLGSELEYVRKELDQFKAGLTCFMKKFVHIEEDLLIENSLIINKDILYLIQFKKFEAHHAKAQSIHSIDLSRFRQLVDQQSYYADPGNAGAYFVDSNDLLYGNFSIYDRLNEYREHLNPRLYKIFVNRFYRRVKLQDGPIDVKWLFSDLAVVQYFYYPLFTHDIRYLNEIEEPIELFCNAMKVGVYGSGSILTSKDSSDPFASMKEAADTFFNLFGSYLSIQKIRRMLEEFSQQDASELLDTVYMLSKYDGTKSEIRLRTDISWRNMTSLHEMHESLVKFDGLEKYPNRVIGHVLYRSFEQITKVKGTQVDIVMPHCTYEIRQWGNDMKHCLGTFSEHCANGDHLIFGFRDRKTGKWIGHAQYHMKYIFHVIPNEDDGLEEIVWLMEYQFVQAYGFKNAVIPESILNPVLRQVTDHLNYLSNEKVDLSRIEVNDTICQLAQQGD